MSNGPSIIRDSYPFSERTNIEREYGNDGWPPLDPNTSGSNMHSKYNLPFISRYAEICLQVSKRLDDILFCIISHQRIEPESKYLELYKTPNTAYETPNTTEENSWCHKRNFSFVQVHTLIFLSERKTNNGVTTIAELGEHLKKINNTGWYRSEGWRERWGYFHEQLERIGLISYPNGKETGTDERCDTQICLSALGRKWMDEVYGW